jgi:hypothetical protein
LQLLIFEKTGSQQSVGVDFRLRQLPRRRITLEGCHPRRDLSCAPEFFLKEGHHVGE